MGIHKALREKSEQKKSSQSFTSNCEIESFLVNGSCASRIGSEKDFDAGTDSICRWLCESRVAKSLLVNREKAKDCKEFLEMRRSSTKQINQSKVPGRREKRMILNESLFNVSKCIKRRFPARLLHTIQENNLFGLASQRFSVLLIIKPSYLYPNLTTQLCDVCLSVRRDKGKQHEKPTKTKQKLEMTRSPLTTHMIHHEL